MAQGGSFIPVEYSRGSHLPELDLWLDPAAPKPFAFVSHAHADHFARHEHIVCSEATHTLIRSRYGKGKAKVTALAFGEDWEFEGYRIKLIPAGHILGSAQIHLTRLKDGATLVYTGDFKLRPGLSCEPCETEAADVVIMETTYGLPRYVFPPTEEVLSAMVKWVRESLEDDRTPILVGYSLGKAQEILSALAGAEVPVALHDSVFRMCRAYEKIQQTFPPYEKLDPEDTGGRVLIVPPSVARSQAIRKIRKRTTAMLSGWATDPGARFRYQVDEVFPLSDHADYPDLVRYVEQVQPKRVLTLHGYAREFARDLRELGIEAWALTGENQMDLPLQTGRGPAAASAPEVPPHPEGGFGCWVDVCESIAAATGRTRKIELLAEYFRGLTSNDIPLAASWFAGRAFRSREKQGRLQVGWAAIRKALQEAAGLDESAYRKISIAQNDPGRTTYLILLQAESTAEAPSLAEMAAQFESLLQARGPHQKIELLAKLFRRTHPLDGQYLVKILTGDLRIGLKEGLLEEGLAMALGVDAQEFREAAMFLGSIPDAAVMAREGRLATVTATPLTPIKCMLASPEPDAEGIHRRLASASGPIWLEDKYDGIRVQLHKRGGKVALFSRDLRSLDREFPEVLEAARSLEGDVILDGELIAFAEGKRLSFFDLQKRLGRRNQSDLFLGPSIPVRFVAFDLLWRDGAALVKEPLVQRRKALESLLLPDGFERVEVRFADSREAIEGEFSRARRAGNEGLIAKDPESPYTPGRRGKTWLKLKKAAATLDVVVVKAQWGHGKRSNVLSDYTFAVRDEDSDELLNIGKAYSGLTDREIEELTEHFKEHTLKVNRRTHTVIPDTVLEIAFDSINPSPRHNSGLALRFPRIKAIRRDKPPAEIDTLQRARRLAGLAEE